MSGDEGVAVIEAEGAEFVLADEGGEFEELGGEVIGGLEQGRNTISESNV